ncbi:hypothetical protein F7731_00135 [Cytobacillus depressus]|uniref:Uncharacterized protein n=1 Tax=Cytobacillus depressus TaxID=1602942 RepID=A0A6L3VAD5_9BACI|nr:hypothetical protein [Cytobacillus depressus]KAB2338029.1 hypothetical protein F7731_00135 [Cytobacillus depressus]
MKAKISLKNTTKNQEIARQIKQANRETNHILQISFKEDFSEILFEGESIFISNKDWFSSIILLEGHAKETGIGYEIKPKDKGKTINLHLEGELVAEINEIRNHVKSKTQHDIILELFKKGLDQYNKENKK